MFLLIMWRSKAVDPAPTLQLPGDGLHPKRPPREACLADRTTRSTCRVLAQKG
jgi:hypothetical protein